LLQEGGYTLFACSVVKLQYLSKNKEVLLFFQIHFYNFMVHMESNSYVGVSPDTVNITSRRTIALITPLFVNVYSPEDVKHLEKDENLYFTISNC